MSTQPLAAAVAPGAASNRKPSNGRAPLVDAATLAATLGVSRDFVYEHADELGALRLGNGPRARLRFDVERAIAALSCYSSEQSQASNPAPALESEPAPAQRARRLPARSPQHAALLPDRPRRTAR